MTEGFFNIKNIKSTPTRPNRSSKIPLAPCEKCGLYKGCKSPKMKWTGKGEQKILFLAEASGREEDEKWKRLGYEEPTQLIGKSGKLLRRKLDKYDFDLDIDGWKDNAVACRPIKRSKDGKESNRPPTDAEVKLCRPHVFKTVEELKPEKIILLGKKAVDSFLGDRTTKIGAISKWVGWQIPDQTAGAWVFPNWHPSYLLRDENNVALHNLFEKYLKQAIEWNVPFPDYGNEAKKVRIILDQEQAETVLRRFAKAEKVKFFAIDFETSGLKPHAFGHKIYCIGISSNGNSAFAFPIFNGPKFLRLLKRFLFNEKIKKIAQNLKFEDTWSRFILGYRIKGWYGDTMLLSHCLDNRQGITGLKFQTYARFGTIGYDDDITKWLKGVDEKDANSFNRLHEFIEQPGGLEKCLTYVGMDAMFTHRLFSLQLNESTERILQKENMSGYNLLLDGTIECSDIQSKGIHTNIPYCQKQDDHLFRRIQRLDKKIQGSEEVKKWKKKTGKDVFNPNSDPELRRILFDIMRYKKGKQTEAKNASVDKEVLIQIGTPFTQMIVDSRWLEKIKDTYLAGFIRESIDGVMRPFFDLHTVRTFRSSSSAPNFQNIPTRDKEAQRITRTAIVPRPGRLLGFADYKGIETRTSCCNTKDPKLIEDVIHGDMHRDESSSILMLPKEEITKDIRYIFKNGWVFPEFYGDWYVSCAKDIWSRIEKLKTVSGTSARSHLAKEGIKKYKDFEKHMEEAEDRFWNKKYTVYRDWKEQIWEDYKRNGYIDLLTGFRCTGLMKKNDVTNYPNQGPAFHCLLWSLIKLNRFFNTEKLKSFIIGQIHDELAFDFDPDELDYLKPIIKKVMCEDIRKHWDWIIVPLDIELEVSEIDGNWYEKREEPI